MARSTATGIRGLFSAAVANRHNSHAPVPAATAMSAANHRPPSHTMKIRTGSAIDAVRIRLAIIAFNCLSAYRGVLFNACDKSQAGKLSRFIHTSAIRQI